jgi:hypothetical protein
VVIKTMLAHTILDGAALIMADCVLFCLLLCRCCACCKGGDGESNVLCVPRVLQDHPRVLQRLREEQAAVQQRRGEPITADALKDMRYADAVIR